MYYVYELVDPRTGVPGYVGITNNPKARHYQHLAMLDGNIEKNSWIRRLEKEEIAPTMRILDTASDRAHAELKERDWINFYLREGISLTNVRVASGRRPSSSLRSRFSFFKRLDRKWEEWQEGHVAFWSESRKREVVWSELSREDIIYQLRRFLSWISSEFPSKRDIIPLWEEEKIQEYREY